LRAQASKTGASLAYLTLFCKLRPSSNPTKKSNEVRSGD
jgi:hypothetical protein